MATKVYVTKAQSRAASALVKRSATSGRYVRPGVAKIAAANTGHSTSGRNGNPESGAITTPAKTKK